jgi:hypothetical protein
VLQAITTKRPTWFPLDGIASPALQLLSTSRRLRARYTGPIINEFRASDSGVTDIRAWGGLGIARLSLPAVGAFCAGTTGGPKSVYDQSGNGRDVSQPTDNAVPGNFTAGAVLGLGGLACVRFDGVNDWLAKNLIGLTAGTSPALTVGFVVKVNTANGWTLNIGGNSTSAQVFTLGGFFSTTTVQYNFSGVPADIFPVANATLAQHAHVYQHAANANLNTDTLEVDGAAVTPTSTGSATISLRADSMRWGSHISAGGGTSTPLAADFTCLLIYNAVLAGQELINFRNCLAQHMAA